MLRGGASSPRRTRLRPPSPWGEELRVRETPGFGNKANFRLGPRDPNFAKLLVRSETNDTPPVWTNESRHTPEPAALQYVPSPSPRLSPLGRGEAIGVDSQVEPQGEPQCTRTNRSSPLVGGLLFPRRFFATHFGPRPFPCSWFERARHGRGCGVKSPRT
jgi:hypothetical protein